MGIWHDIWFENACDIPYGCKSASIEDVQLRRPCPDKEMPPQTITDKPTKGSTCSTLHYANLSVGRRYTLACLSEAYRDTLDSSIKSTFAQSSTVQWMCSRENASGSV
jgi:hypothetical protein